MTLMTLMTRRTLRQTRSSFPHPPGSGRLAAGMLLAIATIVSAREEPATRPGGVTTTQPSTQPATQPGIVDFQPGIRIDWGRRQVLVEGEVVLRQGALELFACSPRTREHESIVRVDARPLHIYQGLGLIGLEPGKPSYYTDDMKTYHPATGAPVEIEVRYTRDGRPTQHPIEEWMRNARNDRSVPRQPWVFAGSFTRDDAFAADPEGTVVAVVDFPSAIIALPRYHSASNDALWVEPATERIPPVGAPCTLIFRPAPLLIQVDRQGRYFLQGQPALLEKITETLKKHATDDALHPVRLEMDPDAPPSRVQALRDVIGLLDLPIDDAESHSANEDEHPHEPGLLLPWMKGVLDQATASRNATATKSASADRLGPSAEIVWFQRMGQIMNVAVEDLQGRYGPYSSSTQPGIGTTPGAELEGE